MSYRISSLFFLTFTASALLATPAASAITPGAAADDAAAQAPSAPYTDDQADELHALRLAGESAAVVAHLTNDLAVTVRKEHRPTAILALAQIDSDLSSEADILLAGVSRPYLGKSWEMMLALGTLFLDTDQARRAVPILKRAQVNAPGNAEVELALLRSLVYANQTEAAINALLAFDRGDQVPPGLRDRVVGNATYFQATRRLDQGHLDDRSLDLLNEASKLLPKDPSVAVSIASLLTEMGRATEADKAIRYVEDNFEARMEQALYLRAVLAEQAGDDEAALRLATDAIHLSARSHIQALAMAGRIGLRIGRHYEARKHLDRLIAISPKHFEGRFLLAQYNLLRAGQTDQAGDIGHYLREAEKNCLHAKVASPHNVANLELLESVYLKLKERGNKNVDLNGVQRDLNVARKIAKRDAKARNG